MSITRSLCHRASSLYGGEGAFHDLADHGLTGMLGPQQPQSLVAVDPDWPLVEAGLDDRPLQVALDLDEEVDLASRHLVIADVVHHSQVGNHPRQPPAGLLEDLASQGFWDRLAGLEVATDQIPGIR